MEGLLPDLDVIRKDFPILERTLAGGVPLVYLDSANTSQKPQVVIDTMVDHLERHNANIARAMHQLGAESTEAFEAAQPWTDRRPRPTPAGSRRCDRAWARTCPQRWRTRQQWPQASRDGASAAVISMRPWPALRLPSHS